MPQPEIAVVIMRQLASSLAMPMLLIDARGDLFFFNEPAEAILGTRFEETGSMTLEEWSAVFKPTDEHGTPLKDEDRPMVTALREQRPVHGRVRIQGVDGVVRSIEATAFPLVGRNGKSLGAVGIFWQAEPKA